MGDFAAAPTVSLTINRFQARHALQGWRKMALDRQILRRVAGLQFVRLLGTGRADALTLGADPLRWARFAVWRDREAFARFEDSAFRRNERALLGESYTLVMRPLRWHGQWGGERPFGEPDDLPSDRAAPLSDDAPLAVLTRASIRPARLRAFWQAVPASQRELRVAPGLLASLGIGELPLLYQATFSLWRSAGDMRAFAYGSPEHREVMARTRREGWYREELFARFEVTAREGSWDGRDPLACLLPGAGHG